MRGLVITAILAAPSVVFAWPWEPDDQEPVVEPVPEPAPPPVEPARPDVPSPDDLAERIDDLEARAQQLERSQREVDSIKDQLEKLRPMTKSVPITAFIDVGAFAVGGNGTGIRSDFLHQHYPGYRNTIAGQWVFMGDPFSTAINTLGEPAETGDSREVEVDTINSSGRASFIVNSLGLGIDKWVTDKIGISALAQLLPRSGPDIVDISYAYVQYRPTQKRDLWFEAGKIDSVLGVEYRAQDAPRRLEITPSLICRYTCGRPIGVGGRWVEGRTSSSAAIVNGDNFEERFEPKTELKANRLPTVAGHLQYKLPVGQGLEIGVSGTYGPQDGQSNTRVRQWHYGFDVKLTNMRGWDVIAEFVHGKQRGATTDAMGNTAPRPTCDLAPCLSYKGAYVLVDRSFGNFTPYVRFDWRDATHRDGADFVYEANSLRGTFGVNYAVTSRVHAKAEYIWNHELGVPAFPHDVITTSVVVATD